MSRQPLERVGEFRAVHRSLPFQGDRTQTRPAFVRLVIAILLTDLLKGIAIGMAVAIFFILKKNYKHSYHYKEEKHQQRETITLRLSEEVTFLNKASIQAKLEHVPSNAHVVIDGSHSVHIDHDVLEIIHNFRAHTAPQRNITVETIGIREVALAAN